MATTRQLIKLAERYDQIGDYRAGDKILRFAMSPSQWVADDPTGNLQNDADQKLMTNQYNQQINQPNKQIQQIRQKERQQWQSQNPGKNDSFETATDDAINYSYNPTPQYNNFLGTTRDASGWNPASEAEYWMNTSGDAQLGDATSQRLLAEQRAAIGNPQEYQRQVKQYTPDPTRDKRIQDSERQWRKEQEDLMRYLDNIQV